MDLLVAIATGLTVWRLVKYSEKRKAFSSSASQLPASRLAHTASTGSGFGAVKDDLVKQDRRIWIKYQDAEGRVTDRAIDIYESDDNYVFAWCHLRKEPRTFKTENILQWKVLNERFQRDSTVHRYINEQLLPKNWSGKIPWEQWQQTISTRPRSVSSPQPTIHAVAEDKSPHWVPPGKEVCVNGYRITKGGIYVGSGLGAINGWSSTEPALIDPKLPVDSANADKTGRNMPYWSSYNGLTPAIRAGYLGWLEKECRNPDVHVGYPFLFLYGLERRLLGNGDPFRHDKNELVFIEQELKSLLSLFGKIASFQRYAGSFLEVVQASLHGASLSELPPPAERISDTLPCTIQLVVARWASASLPLPAVWALALVLCHPETRLRMPARRCREELEELFRLRYKDEFQDGMILRPSKSLLKLQYRPASPSFGKEIVIPTALPQVSALKSIPSKLFDLVERCIDELDAYSRHVGNKDAGEADLASIALLPIELVKQHQGRVSLDFKEWVDSVFGNADVALVPAENLLARWKKTERLSKGDCVHLAQLLEKWEYAIEPDVRFGGPPLRADGKVVIFRLQSGASSTPSPEYALATLLLDLGVTVVMADGVLSSEEERRLEHQLEVALRMGEPERRRLRAHLRWLTSEERNLVGLSKRLETLQNTEKARLAQFMISLAGADGYVKSEEVKALSKIYSLFGFPESQIHADLHSLSLPGSTSVGEELVMVRSPEHSHGDYRIPPQQPKAASSVIQLDMEKVNAKLSESATVSALLATIFTEKEELTPAKPAKALGIGNLDAGHSQLLIALSAREAWERALVDELASQLNLLPDGALELINEASFDAVGEALWEGDDPIRINISIAKEMLTCQTSR